MRQFVTKVEFQPKHSKPTTWVENGKVFSNCKEVCGENRVVGFTRSTVWVERFNGGRVNGELWHHEFEELVQQF